MNCHTTTLPLQILVKRQTFLILFYDCFNSDTYGEPANYPTFVNNNLSHLVVSQDDVYKFLNAITSGDDGIPSIILKNVLVL